MRLSPRLIRIAESRSHFGKFSCALIALLWLVQAGRANYRESFESSEPTWQLADRDCPVQVINQQRTLQVAHSGKASEHLRIQAGRGTFIHLVQEVPHGRVFAEWQPSLWVRADRGGLQLMARAVLPRSVDPKTGQPLTVLLKGDIYDRPGVWQQLVLRQADKALQEQVRLLHATFGHDVDASLAFVDMIVLNVYGGAGTTNVWIDDLEIPVHVPLTQLASHRSDVSDRGTTERGDPTTATFQPPRPPIDHARLQGSTLIVDGRPFFPRIIQHNGESFQWLASVGFNAVRLAAPPTQLQLREAEQFDLWLVCPPPTDTRLITPLYDRVIAWDLGSRLDEQRLEMTRRWVGELRRNDIRPTRPLVCQAVGKIWNYSRLTSLVSFDASPIGSEMSLAEYGDWFRRRQSLVRPGTPTWAQIQTEPARELVEQWRAIGLGLPASTALEPQQIRALVFQSLASGARGLLFKSHAPLNAQDPDTILRARTLQRINTELSVIEPWTAGAARPGDVHSEDPTLRIGSLQTERAQLLMLVRQHDGDQFATRASADGPLTFIAPSLFKATHVYRITPGGLRTLQHRRVAGGLRITLDEAESVSLLAVTQDPLVISHLTKTLANQRRELSQLNHEIVARSMAGVEQTHRLLSRHSGQLEQQAEWLAQSSTNLRHCELLLGANDFQAANIFADRCRNWLARVRRSHWEQAVSPFASPVASPYCVSFSALPQHWVMSSLLQNSQIWSANSLAAGDFENLEHLRRTGWTNVQYPDNQTQTAVELSPQFAHGGQNSLRLAAFAADPKHPPTAIERPPVRIVSAPIPVRQGQLVRIHGWAYVPQPIELGTRSLMVHDSFGGSTLAARIKSGEQWQPFVLYRAAPADDELRITIALSGLGQAWIDDLSVTIHEPIVPREKTPSFDQARRLPRVDGTLR